MSWLNDRGVAPKLIGGFVFVALLAALVGAAGVLGLGTMQGTIDTMTQNSVPNLV